MNENRRPPARGPNVRHRSRRAAVQALYQWQATAQDADDIIRQFLEDSSRERMDKKLFREMVRGTTAEVEAIDAALTPCLDRPVAQVDPVERAILRLGAWELMCRLEVPLVVVINEAVELTKTFGAEASHRFVNGVLDRLADVVRPEADAVRAARRSR